MNKIEEICNKQRTLNVEMQKAVKPGKNIDIGLAGIIEIAEMVSEVDWKWWKDKKTDYIAVQREIVDVLHFSASELSEYPVVLNFQALEITIDKKNKQGLKFIETNEEATSINAEIIRSAKAIIKGFLNQDSIETMKELYYMAGVAGISSKEMYKIYIAKNTTNKFRQMNGDKDGKYIKVWDDKLDDEYAIEYANTIEIDKQFEENILNHLSEEYKKVLKEKNG